MGWRFASADKDFQLCGPGNYYRIAQLITDTLSEDANYSSQPIELRNQRVYAIKVNTTRCAKMYRD